ncbi:MAG: hypothetical protein LPK45_03410, partial [Bacteroidota bacterium]|nr:hypothetical protein [Bacteroidota bacterium]MDX5430095.1 hypothetical protein [Bacteroidota bacterium]MDX5468859.1 hypothetical protein [Bacteroidota bacterium]
MKKHYLIMLGILASMGALAQDNYSFTTRTENYTEMTSGTVISDSDWDDFEVRMAMPFAFKYFGESVDSITIADDGLYFTTEFDDYLSPHGQDAVARGADMSPVSYRIDGTGSNRILKVQWPNITFVDTKDGFVGDFVNYQVWMYEGTNVIEFHIGSSFVSEGALA